MTASQKLTYLPNLNNWLINTVQKSTDGKYYHRRLEENLNARTDILKELKVLIHQAHEDARKKIRDLIGIPCSLDPLEEETTLGINTSIIDNFPQCLELTTLKGYFGEIMAAVVAENFNPFGENWQVLAFPFRAHQAAFHALEKIRQEGGVAPTIPGRLGDDMLAFKFDEQGKITHILSCEAKCTNSHSTKLIDDAHQKISDKKLIPVDCRLIKEILLDYVTVIPEAEQWIHALSNLYLYNPTHERCDLVSYICGLPPARADTVVISTDQPHSDYTAGRRLEAVEIHLNDVDGLIEEVYQVMNQPITCTLKTEELSQIWNKVICSLPKQNQSLIKENCDLLAFNEKEAIIGVHHLIKFRDIQRKISNLKDAFQEAKMFTPNESQKKIGIKLKNIEDINLQEFLTTSWEQYG